MQTPRNAGRLVKVREKLERPRKSGTELSCSWTTCSVL